MSRQPASTNESQQLEAAGALRLFCVARLIVFHLRHDGP
jgi:hypothetical protein